MNKLLIFLGVIALVVGGLVVASGFGYSFPGIGFFSPLVLSLVIIGIAFIRFDHLFGFLSLIVGGVALLSIMFFHLEWVENLLPWFLIVMAVRFLVIGSLSEENLA